MKKNNKFSSAYNHFSTERNSLKNQDTSFMRKLKFGSSISGSMMPKQYNLKHSDSNPEEDENYNYPTNPLDADMPVALRNTA